MEVASIPVGPQLTRAAAEHVAGEAVPDLAPGLAVDGHDRVPARPEAALPQIDPGQGVAVEGHPVPLPVHDHRDLLGARRHRGQREQQAEAPRPPTQPAEHTDSHVRTRTTATR